MRVPPTIALACVALACLAPALCADDGASSSVPWIRCTPTTVQLPGGEIREAVNPIARALEEASPGSVVHLDPGDYPAFTIGFDNHSPNNARAAGGNERFPVVIDGLGSARIIGKGDAIAIDQRVPNAHITFKNLTIVPGQRSGVIFYRQSHRVHRGYAFEDCHILGGYDHVAGRGNPSKWGLSGHSLADFRFEGVTAPARVERIRDEHAFYIQNHRGPVLIRNVRAWGLGRTFCQFTARARDGAPGYGDITVRDCDVFDVCLSSRDGFKGGAAFTFAGRLRCTIELSGNIYRAGFREPFRALTRPGQPYGTGAVAVWQGGEAQRNGTLVLRDNRFLLAPESGDRPVVTIGGCDRVLLVGSNEIVAGGEYAALALDPVNAAGRPVSSPNGSVFLAPQTKLRGDLTIGAKAATEEERLGLEKP